MCGSGRREGCAPSGLTGSAVGYSCPSCQSRVNLPWYLGTMVLQEGALRARPALPCGTPPLRRRRGQGRAALRWRKIVTTSLKTRHRPVREGGQCSQIGVRCRPREGAPGRDPVTASQATHRHGTPPRPRHGFAHPPANPHTHTPVPATSRNLPPTFHLWKWSDGGLTTPLPTPLPTPPTRAISRISLTAARPPALAEKERRTENEEQ